MRDDWLDETSSRKRRRRVALLATAATVLVAVFAAFNTGLVPGNNPVQLAVIEKSFGPVFLLGEESELRPGDDLSAVMSGQTIVTGNDAGMALAWDGGGSVRIDESTRIRFEVDGSVFLESGRAYFDSQPAMLAAARPGNAPAFQMKTAHGTVRHTGTQYMTRVDAESLVVSVREGEVAIDGVVYDQVVEAGQQAMLSGRQRPNLLSISSTSDAWAWVAKTTPVVDVDGKSLHEFLVWVSRELGLELRFEGQSESIAQQAVLKGNIDAEPSEALRLRLATAALDWRIQEGVIYITD